MDIQDLIKGIFEGDYEIITKEVKNFGTSGAIYLPKKYNGKKVVVIIQNENLNLAGATASAVIHEN